jgi:TolA-binding protein
MAEDRYSLPAAQEQRPGNRRGRALRCLTHDLLERLQRNVFRSMSVFLVAVTVIIGLAVAAQYLPTNRQVTERSITLSDALAQLNAGFVEQARETAVELRRGEALAEEELGGPAYVLGVAMVYDAAQRTRPNERRSLYLLAARYLEEAEQLGYPEGREGHGRLLLGKARFETGHFSASFAPLHDALALATDDTAEIHRLLAEAYLRDSTPDLAKALEHIQRYLADSAVDESSHEGALLTAAEIQFQLKDVAGCREILAQLPEDSRSRAHALLMDGRMLMDEGDEILASSSEDAEERSIAKYRTAQEAFTSAQARNPGNVELVRKAQYLLGLAYSKLGEDEEAERRFTRTHRSSYETSEGLAAGFEAAEVLRLLARYDEAIEAYGDVLRQALDMPVYSNPWLPFAALRDRSELAFQDFFDRGDFERAIRMANALSPLLSMERALELQAQAHGAEARKIQLELDEATFADATRLEESQAAWRRAAALYEELSVQRFATRQYPDLLWKSAQGYLNGHDYGRAARLLRAYLHNQVRRFHPPALTALGKANLASGLLEKAIEPLMECIEFFPRDPHVYQARLLAAEANVELGKLEQAKQLLVVNLENGELTPCSPDWRDSLYALGRIYYREGMETETDSRLKLVDSDQPEEREVGIKSLEQAQRLFRESVSRLSEAVKRDELGGRDQNSPETLEARYFIAEAHRQIAKLPLRQLKIVSIETTRDQLNGEIQRDLSRSAEGYRTLQSDLNRKQETVGLSHLEAKFLRNSYFARADVLYDLKKFEEAIDAYATATNRYQHEPEALEAYVQIANCHRLQNRHSEARGILESAKVVLNRIRQDADFTQTTRYNREEWKRLLDWLTAL